ncbi:toll/interleukin-1 receptor domain-containing protein [Haliscomenobacter sp.]|uniref:toll/interleukin-1 receptor domain-containing protein n=1 Tax=Haliscomenobacter sp. TaxID=2717303 RepID=UPI003BA8E7E4
MAKIFLSYAGEDLAVAQQLYYALSKLSHQVFFDKKSLSHGAEYNFRIVESIRESDFAILLLSPDFFSAGSYCQTELKIIEENWPIPEGRIFPILARDVPFDILPDYIKSVTILKIEGNLVAETVKVIQDNLLGFKSRETVSVKLKKIEVEWKLEALDQKWAQTKKEYYPEIRCTKNETRPVYFYRYVSVFA